MSYFCQVHFILRLSFFVILTKNKEQQLHCLCLKMTTNFGKFVTKTDEIRKTKDEMNPALAASILSEGKKGYLTFCIRFPPRDT